MLIGHGRAASLRGGGGGGGGGGPALAAAPLITASQTSTQSPSINFGPTLAGQILIGILTITGTGTTATAPSGVTILQDGISNNARNFLFAWTGTDAERPNNSAVTFSLSGVENASGVSMVFDGSALGAHATTTQKVTSGQANGPVIAPATDSLVMHFWCEQGAPTLEFVGPSGWHNHASPDRIPASYPAPAGLLMQGDAGFVGPHADYYAQWGSYPGAYGVSSVDPTGFTRFVPFTFEITA